MRTLGGVVLGYAVVAIVVFLTFTATYLAIGAEGAFRPGSYEISTQWAILSLALGLAAAIVGGVVCATVAATPRAPKILAAVILGLGLLLALPVLGGSDAPKTRESGVGSMEAMRNAEQPVWIALLNPVIGAAGVILGARLVRARAEGA